MKNIGSIRAIYYALASDIESISAQDENGKVEITLKAGKSITAIDFTVETASFTEEMQLADAGVYYDQQLSCKVPMITWNNTSDIRTMVYQELVLIITDGNGDTTVMGSLETPARASAKLIRPAATSGYNGYELSFKCSSIDPAPYLDESFVLS